MSRGFSVAHQKVYVDVDIAENALRGTTELTLVPTTPDLGQIHLDAHNIKILETQVNGKNTEFAHKDSQEIIKNMPSSWTVEQHHLFKEKILWEHAERPAGELLIDIPKDVTISDQMQSATAIVAHSAQENTYEPLTVKVVFENVRPSSGINFVGSRDSKLPPTSWHAYTTQSPLGRATSCWVPCVDGFETLCTWQLEFAVPKTVRDMLAATRGADAMNVDNEEGDQSRPNGKSEEEETHEVMDDGSNDGEENELDREIVVVCNNNSPSQIAHPTDPNKKIVSFEMFTPIFAHHVGFSVGPFHQTPMSSSAEDGEEASGTSGIAFAIYSLPDKISEVSNSCGIFAKAMEYFTRDFGSFPFTSYSICFVSDFPFDAADAAALTNCSDKLLFPPDTIEPLFTNTEHLIRCLAAQWCGVNIVPRRTNDIWVTEGIALYMTRQFLRRLMGNNEYRYRMRRRSDELIRQDINRQPLGKPNFQFPFSVDDLGFIRLKAPLVLYILDRRMTKTDRSLGLSRVIPKLLLQSMSGDLNSQVSTEHFIKLCEKVAHHRLTQFFEQWVYSSGYPIFRVTQRFNKKRMFIEMGIGQVQSRELPAEVLKDGQYVELAVQEILREREDRAIEVPAAFTGPMTIRIHEADGTPYEHVVFLKDSFTKLDIQYNTKYKRLKRTQKFRSGGADGIDGSESIGGLIHCMGDVLMRDRDIEQWKLSDWGQDDEEYMFNEAFEWIRVDSDFEWIGQMFVGQPDYMYASQLQQDRDVVAQYDAVTFFSTQTPNAIYSSILARTLMDRRYFYQVRVHAAFGLVNSAVPSLNYLGKFHLLKAFQEMFCFENSLIPKANNFTDFPSYFVQKAIPSALSYVRNEAAQCPPDVANFLLDLIRYNENSGNPYSDSQYLCTLMSAVVNVLRPVDNDYSLIDYGDPTVHKYVERVVSEIDKCQRLDRWLPSYHHIVSVTAIQQDEKLIRYGYGAPRMERLLLLTKSDLPADVRLAAFQSVLDLGGYRNRDLLRYVCQSALEDESLMVRFGIIKALAVLVGTVALHGEYNAPGVAKPTENNPTRARQDALARQTIKTSIPLAREAFSHVKALKEEIWCLISTPSLGTLERRLLLEICEVIYESRSSLVVILPTPKLFKLGAKRKKDYLMVIRYRSVIRKNKGETVPEAKPPPLKLKLSL